MDTEKKTRRKRPIAEVDEVVSEVSEVSETVVGLHEGDTCDSPAMVQSLDISSEQDSSDAHEINYTSDTMPTSDDIPLSQDVVACVDFKFGIRLYNTACAVHPMDRISGTYYIWSSEEFNGRIRVCKHESDIGNSDRCLGWVNVCEIGRYRK